MKIVVFVNSSHNIVGRLYKTTKTLAVGGHTVVVVAKKDACLPKTEQVGEAEVRRQVEWPRTRVPLVRQLVYSFRWIRAGIGIETDAYMVTDADTLFEAAFCAWWKKKRLVYDSTELFLDILSFRGKPLARLYWWLKERWGVKRADVVIAANKERAQVMRERYPFIKRIEVIENFPSLESDLATYVDDRAAYRRKLGVEDSRVFIFQGFLNRGRGLEELGRALSLINTAASCTFLIIGDGNYRGAFAEEIRKKNLASRVIFTGKVPYLELPKYLSAGDVGMVFYPPVCRNYIYAAPNKLYEYMMAHLAVLSNDIPTIKRVIEKEKSGVYCDASDPAILAKAIDTLASEGIDSMKERGHQAAVERYNWEYQAPVLLDIFSSLT